MQLTPQASLGFCQIAGDIGVRIRKKGGDAIALCAYCSFQREDWVLTPRVGGES